MPAEHSIPCSLAAGVLTFQLPTDRSTSVPLSVANRSGTLRDALDTVEDNSELAVVAPPGFLEHWLASTESDDHESLSTAVAIQRLKAVDFFEDEHATVLLCSVLASRLYIHMPSGPVLGSTSGIGSAHGAPQQVDSQESPAGILDALHDDLAVRVLRASDAPLNRHCSSLPPRHHALAVRATYPLLHKHPSLSLDCESQVLAAVTATLGEFAKSTRREKSLTVLSAPVFEYTPAANAFTAALCRVLTSGIQSLTLVIGKLDEEGLRKVLEALRMDDSLEELDIDFTSDVRARDVPWLNAVLQEFLPLLTALRALRIRGVNRHHVQDRFTLEGPMQCTLMSMPLLTSLQLDWDPRAASTLHMVLSCITGLRYFSLRLIFDGTGEKVQPALPRGDTSESPTASPLVSKIIQQRVPALETLIVEWHAPVVFRDQQTVAGGWCYPLLAPFLDKAHNLKQLRLQHMLLNRSCMRPLYDALSDASALEALEVGVLKCAVITLLEHVSRLTTLTELDLSAACPDQAVPQGAEEGMGELVYERVRRLGRLKKLSIPDLSVDASVRFDFAEVALPGGPEASNLRVFGFLSTLTHLSIGPETVTDSADAAAPLSAWRCLVGLRSLAVYGNAPLGASDANLAAGLSSLRNLQEMKLADCNCIARGLAWLACSFVGLSKLTKLDLQCIVEHSQASDDLAQVFSEMSALTGLQWLNIRARGTRHGSMRGPPMAPVAASAFAASASRLAALSHLQLKHRIEGEAALRFIEGLGKLSSLQTLDSMFFQISQEHMPLFATTLWNVPELRVLKLGAVGMMNPDSTIMLANALRVLTNLSHLGFNGPSAAKSEAATRAVAELLRLRQNIRKCSLGAMALSAEGAPMLLECCSMDDPARLRHMREFCMKALRGRASIDSMASRPSLDIVFEP